LENLLTSGFNNEKLLSYFNNKWFV
jgi:hypothetical protein